MNDLSIPEWRRLEPTAMDDLFVLVDQRTRERPVSLIVDAIDTEKRGGYHVDRTIKWAKWSVENAVRSLELASSASDANEVHLTMAALCCLFAIRCLNRESPVVGLVGVPGELERPLELLRTFVASKSTDETKLGRNILSALLLMGMVCPNDDRVKADMRQLRSWAWSSDIPGLVIYMNTLPSTPKHR